MQISKINSLLSSPDFMTFSADSLASDPALLAKRIRMLKKQYSMEYSSRDDVSVFSVSGRTEICGNHTDHNRGMVVAASVNADLLAIAAPNTTGTVRLHSVGFPEDVVNLSEYVVPDPSRYYTSESLIAGMCALFVSHGYRAGGFTAVTESQVPGGSGLSSSAAFEVAVGTILNHLYNDGKISPVEIAKIAQEAENQFFGKPCGLMDQMACAVGGMIAIDFRDADHPIIVPLHFSPSQYGYVMALTSTGGSHANLNEDYASIPREMKQIASAFGKNVLREVNERDFKRKIPELRNQYGDRAVLRAIHFFHENHRALRLIHLLRNDNETSLASFTQILNESGASSQANLQNIYPSSDIAHQGISLALTLSRELLQDVTASTRVHGGGFAGTIQSFLPQDLSVHYQRKMNSVFGPNACRIFQIRPAGASKIL